MASDAEQVRKNLIEQGFEVRRPTGRGKTSYEVVDRGQIVARFPVSPSPGSWRANLEAAIRRYRKTGVPARSSRVVARP